MGDASEHSLLSASGAARWTRCYGSVALESTQPNPPSKYAAEGTAAHGLAAYLLSGQPNKEITEHMLEVLGTDHYHVSTADKWIGQTIIADGMPFEVDADFAEAVQRYVDYVRSLPGELLVETRVNYANHLGVPTDLAWGTSDAIVIHDGSEIITITADGYLCVDEAGRREVGMHHVGEETFHTGRLIATTVDLKFGAGVPVYPDNNEQGMLYTGGALNDIELMHEVRPTDIIRIVIHQPRIGEGEPLEWYITVAELRMWLKTEAAMAAQHAVKLVEKVRDNAETTGDISAIVATSLTPGDKQCRFCKAKAVCPAIYKTVVESVAGGFVDLDNPTNGTVAKAISATQRPLADLSNDDLAKRMKLTDMAERWINEVRSLVEVKLLAGETIPGFKIVQGKKGARSWADDEKALKKLKTVLGAKYAAQPVKPVSPTTVEGMVKRGDVTERQWKALQDMIVQKEGGKHVAREDDPRPAISCGPDVSAFTAIEDDDAYAGLA